MKLGPKPLPYYIQCLADLEYENGLGYQSARLSCHRRQSFHDFQPDNAELTDQIREGQGKIFTEDLEMLEQQQQNILNNPHRKLLMLNIDAGGVQSRKVIERLLAEENKTPPETSAQKFPNIRII